jgi:aryl-alcohol dehydrogenase-like predicted oxidoreductase
MAKPTIGEDTLQMIFSLGSAGWRSIYGVLPTEMLSLREIESLTLKALTLGFKWIDTAPGYGDTEKYLGVISPPQSVATKIIVDESDLSLISKSIENSLDNLKLDSLELVFIHNWDKLITENREVASHFLDNLVRTGIIKHWGFSTYDIGEIIRFSQLDFRNIHIQINSNVLDQRLLENGLDVITKRFASQGHKLWLRSIFLQGILLDIDERNPFINHNSIVNFHAYCLKKGYTPMEVCLGYVQSLPIVDYVILGINNSQQLEEIASALSSTPSGFDYSELKSNDLDLIDPRNWRK